MRSFEKFKQLCSWVYVILFHIWKYNIRNGLFLKLPVAKSTYYGINSVHFRARLSWNCLPQSVKHSESIFELKRKLEELGNAVCFSILVFISFWYLEAPTENKVLNLKWKYKLIKTTLSFVKMVWISMRSIDLNQSSDRVNQVFLFRAHLLWVFWVLFYLVMTINCYIC